VDLRTVVSERMRSAGAPSATSANPWKWEDSLPPALDCGVDSHFRGGTKFRLGHHANPFDYLTELQKHAEELAKNPAVWMPWNYCQTLASRPVMSQSEPTRSEGEQSRP
jgi:hypothetical protein